MSPRLVASSTAIRFVARLRVFVLLGAALLVAGAAHAEVSVQATVDRTTVAVGEPFILSIEISGTQNAAPPETANVGDFQMQYLGPSSEVSFVNGRVSAKVSHRYRLVGRKEGVHSLGPFQVSVDGETFETEPIRVRVSAGAPGQRAGGALPSDEQLRLVVTTPKLETYMGEGIPLEVKLYVGNVQVDDLQYPKIPIAGVTLAKLSEPERRNEIVNGRRYQTLSFKTRLTPIHPGELDLTATMAMNLLRPRGRRRGGDPFFDRFFNGFFNDAERQPIEVQADPVKVTVLPLPEEGRPADFTGAVGRFNFLLTAKPTQLAVGDPITVRMQIRGQGNLSSLTPPNIPTDERFRKYDAQPVKDEERVGQRVYEQVVIPRQEGISELPAVTFSFFDPELRRYRTIRQGPIALQIMPAEGAGEAQVLSQGDVLTPPKPAERLGRDIVFIKDSPGDLRSRGPSFYTHSWFVGLQLVPVALFVGLATVVRRRERFASDPRLVRFHQAGRDARRRLAGLSAQTEGTAFYDELTAIVHSYLAAKLDLPPGAVESSRVLERLGNGAGNDVREHLSSFFQLVEGARYAPGQTAPAQRERALHLAHEIVDGFERQRAFFSRSTGRLSVLLLAALLPLSGVEASKSGELTAFYRGNAAYQEGTYDVAVRSYQEILDAGLESGPLYFNLGNAYFKNGQLGRAILSYERAERLLPRDPDVRVNLAYALEVAEEEEPAKPFWQGILFPLASRATTGQLAIATTVLWFAFWTLLALRLWNPVVRIILGRVAWCVLAAVIVVGGSFVFRLALVDLQRDAVVVNAGETAVRFEPSENGTEHFRVGEGALLVVTDQRDGWFQVRRWDGRRGWIPAGALEQVNVTTGI